MKEKISNVLFIISITYSIVIILLMFISYSTSINNVMLNDNSNNKKLLSEYKESLREIDESACKDTLVDLINYYEKTSYDGIVNLTDIYNRYMNGDSVISYSSKIINNCNLDDKEKSFLANRMVDALLQFDDIIQQLYFQYEIRIPDINARVTQSLNMNETKYNLNRKNELEIIKMLIDVLEGETEYECE